jgi:hypothetical protein
MMESWETSSFQYNPSHPSQSIVALNTLTYHLWKLLVMESHHPVMKTHLWKPFLKNKELSFEETIFEK